MLQTSARPFLLGLGAAALALAAGRAARTRGGPVVGPQGLAGGVDVSGGGQGSIDWAAAKASGLDFAFLKATEAAGPGLVDGRFFENWQGTKAAGVPRGAYHYFRPQIDPEAQANLFLNTVPAPRGELPCVLDVEEMGGMKPDAVAVGVELFVRLVAKADGRPPMIYTSPGFWNALPDSDAPKFALLWVAHWGVKAPTVPRGWSDWMFWQYSSTGKQNGISRGVDRNAFHGDRLALASFIATLGQTGAAA